MEFFGVRINVNGQSHGQAERRIRTSQRSDIRR